MKETNKTEQVVKALKQARSEVKTLKEWFVIGNTIRMLESVKNDVSCENVLTIAKQRSKLFTGVHIKS